MTKISDEGREILQKWQGLGVKFEQVAMPLNTYLDFKRDAESYSIPEQPVPDGWAASHLNNALTDGIKFSQRDGLTESGMIGKRYLLMRNLSGLSTMITHSHLRPTNTKGAIRNGRRTGRRTKERNPGTSHTRA